MQEIDIYDLPDLVNKNKRLLGLDPGTKTIGVAVSDRDFKVASPVKTIKRTKFKNDAQELKEICADKNIGGIVMGLPVNMDGSEGPRCQSVRTLADNLKRIAGFEIPIVFWDERMSTSAVERFLIGEADMTRKNRAKVIDKAAAAYILQGALDAIQRKIPFP
ncbi:Holliday junction resolvase [Kiloniella litopenaei]|uniref:Putative pre-16S rRNA nuclease n=1 Tax=Kiloniella litopenaei TaxID=1549748 RepID=A0A0M2R424_9PROT|nr:Holliday junction resolvase RuvX [Kiloniella litopenaei]KKJ76637.1 Holliday junction resolvase [Kiloniella litopenaei]